jgi:hypothetical protein
MKTRSTGGSSDPPPKLCPSAQPELGNAVAFGLVDHTADPPEVAYLERPLPISDELLELAGPLKPTEIFRFAAPCQTSACSHWNGSACKLATRIVQLLPAAHSSLPRCNIRSACRWYAQEGRKACERCPLVVTQNEIPSDAMREAATPK